MAEVDVYDTDANNVRSGASEPYLSRPAAVTPDGRELAIGGSIYSGDLDRIPILSPVATRLS